MRLILAVILAVIIPSPATAQTPSSKDYPPRPKPPEKVDGRSLKEWRAALKVPRPDSETDIRDASLRARAALAIIGFGEDAALAIPDLLKQSLRDPDVSPRAKALMALRLIPTREPGDDAKDWLPEILSSLAGRLAVIDKAGNHAEPQATLRYEVLVTLQRFIPDLKPDGPAIKQIIAASTTKASWEIRHMAISILWRAGMKAQRREKGGPPDDGIVSALIDAVERTTDASMVRMEALVGLALLGKPEDADLQKRLANALKSPAAGSDAHAIWAFAALSHLGDLSPVKNPLQELERHLRSTTLETRCQAISALGSLGKSANKQIPQLLALLDDKEPMAVEAACRALISIGDKSAPVAGKLASLVTAPANPKDAHRPTIAIQTLVALEATDPKVLVALEAIEKNARVGATLSALAGEARKALLAKKKEPREKARKEMGQILARQAMQLAKERSEKAFLDIDKVGEKTVTEWRKELKNPDPSLRAMAVLAIMQFGENARDAVPELLEIVRADKDVSPRAKALLALRSIDIRDRHISDIIRTLADRLRPAPGSKFRREGQATLRYETMLTLGRFTEDIAGVKPVASAKDRTTPMQCLISASKDEDSWELRHTALGILWKAAALDKAREADGPDKGAIKALLDALENPYNTGQVKLEALIGLASLGKPSGDTKLEQRLIKTLVSYTNAPSRGHTVGTRARLVWALAALVHLGENPPGGVKSPLTRLVNLLDSKELDTKCQALAALGTLGKDAKKHIPQLLKLLDDEEIMAVQAACRALGAIGDKSDKVIDKLLALATPGTHKDPTRQERENNRAVAMIQTLMAMGRPRPDVLAALKKLQEDNEANSGLRQLAGIALDELTRPTTPKKK